MSAVDYGWTMDESYANYGSTVDILAPGDFILSIDATTDDKFIYNSGTSMAAPHVAGLVLYYMSVEGISGTDAITKRIFGDGN